MKSPNEERVTRHDGPHHDRSAASAKCRLLSWARHHDARSHTIIRQLGPMLAAGVVTSIFGVLLLRAAKPRRKRVLQLPQSSEQAVALSLQR